MYHLRETDFDSLAFKLFLIQTSIKYEDFGYIMISTVMYTKPISYSVQNKYDILRAWSRTLTECTIPSNNDQSIN